MSGARNQPPSAKRLRDARARGDVAVSRELTSAVAWCTGVGVLGALGPTIVSSLARHLREALGAAAAGADVAPWRALTGAALLLARVAAAPLVASAVAACACGALQTRGLFTLSAAAPRWTRIDPAAGIRRIFSGAQLGALALSLPKAIAVLLIAWAARGMIAGSASALAGASTPLHALAGVPHAARMLATRIAPLLLACGLLDLLIVRRRHRDALRMTADEVRREQKEQDGDPRHRAERQRLHRALAAAVPVARASCVVVNPTHLAVALHHDARGEGAPVVVAKGSGEAAARIREDATAGRVPIVRDVPLARALFRLVDVGDEIPEELYEAAAAVLVHVHGLTPEENP